MKSQSAVKPVDSAMAVSILDVLSAAKNESGFEKLFEHS
jgi:hypothetical protein